MSTYDDASLVMIPSGYKTGTVFSQKPMSTDGQLTFTRSNDTATRVGPDGLIEKVRTNLVLHSQNFSNAAWSKSAGTTLTHSQTDPDGGTTATRVVMTSGTNNFFTQAISGSGTRFITLSVFVKGVTTGGSFSLNTGTAASRTGTTITYTTTWTRYQIIQNETTSNTGFQIDNFSNSLGQVAGDFLIAFAQTESSDFGATPYIATTTAAVSVGPVANVPRLDYLNSSCPRLLLEPQRVNLALFSEQMNNAYWSTLDATVSANAFTSPTGETSADAVVGSGTGTIVRLSSTAIGGTLSASHTASCFLKKGTNDFALFQASVTGATGVTFAYIDLVNGTSPQSGVTIQDYGNGWYRVSFTFTLGATFANINLRIFPTLSTTTTAFATNADALNKSVLVWGCQLEASASYASSYVNTLGAAVTRGADAASKTGISSLIGQTEGTLFVDVVPTDISSLARYISISATAGVGSGWIGIFASGSNTFRFFGDGWTFSAGAQVRGTRYKVAMAYKNGVLTSAYVNGTSVGTLTANTTGKSYDNLTLASAPIGNAGCSDFFQSIIFPTALSNAQLAELTA